MDDTRYLEDLKVIREVLRENEERPLVEWWAFVIWGFLVIAGTVATSFLMGLGLTAMESLLYLWIPVLILGSAGEVTALLIKLNKEETPLFTRRFIKLFATFFFVFVALLAIVVPLVQAGVSPGVLMVFASVPVVFYAHASFSGLYLEAGFLLLLGIFLEFLPANPPWLYVAVGIGVGLFYCVGGIHSRIAERGRRG